METAKEIQYKGHTIEILYDEYFNDTPDKWDDEGQFIVYDHRNFYVEVKGFNPSDIFDHISETNRMFYKGYFVFTLYAYIHSGVSLSVSNGSYPFNDRWDVSTTGFVLIKRRKGTYTREAALKHAKGLVGVWNDILSGQVYGYNTDVDSCYGYIGDSGIEDAIKHAKASIDYAINKKINTHIVELKKKIRAKVPFQYRTPLVIN